MNQPKPPPFTAKRTGARRSLSAQLMTLANQTAPVEADFDAVREAIEAERARKGTVPIAFMTLEKEAALDKELADSRRAVAADPNSGSARMRLADALRDKGETAEAITAYRQCLQWPQYAEPARYFLAALGAGEQPAATPMGLVRETFDVYAPSFEQDLVGTLRYQGPALLHQSVRGVVGATANRLDVFDAGCGTGLCGKVFRPMARSLVGVDASSEMIRRAREKGVYDELIHGELCEVLGRYRDAFDLVVAGDVLIYLGGPDAIMAAAWCALRQGGHFAFTTERLDGTGYDLPPTGRYRHSDACIEEAAAKAGFRVARMDRAALRFERRVGVDSSVFVLSKTRRA